MEGGWRERSEEIKRRSCGWESGNEVQNRKSWREASELEGRSGWDLVREGHRRREWAWREGPERKGEGAGCREGESWIARPREDAVAGDRKEGEDGRSWRDG